MSLPITNIFGVKLEVIYYTWNVLDNYLNWKYIARHGSKNPRKCPETFSELLTAAASQNDSTNAIPTHFVDTSAIHNIKTSCRHELSNLVVEFFSRTPPKYYSRTPIQISPLSKKSTMEQK